MTIIEWLFRSFRGVGSAMLTTIFCFVLAAVVGTVFLHLELVPSLILGAAAACVVLLTFHRPQKGVREFSDDPKDWGTSRSAVVRIARALDLYPEDPEEGVAERLLYAGRREHPINMFWIVVLDLMILIPAVYLAAKYPTYHLRYTTAASNVSHAHPGRTRLVHHDIVLHGWWALAIGVLPAFWILKAYLTWCSRFFVVTSIRIALVVSPPSWAWFMSDSVETYWVESIERIQLIRPWWVKLLLINSGTVRLDTFSDQDRDINDIPAVWRAKLIVEDIWREVKRHKMEATPAD